MAKSSKPDNLLEKVSALLPIPRWKKAGADAKPQTPPDAIEIENWIVQRLAFRLGTPSADIDPTLPFASFGMDSQNALGLSGDLEDWLGVELSPTLVWDYPTVRQLSCHLATEGIQDCHATLSEQIAGQEG
jgi:acyl carrier protein